MLHFWSTATVFSRVPNPIRFVLPRSIRQQPGTLARISAYLNSPTSLPPVPRLYLYSPIDELIPPEDVERHAAQARTEAGVTDIRMEKFEKSPHVAHARTDPERYWSAVKRVWEESGEETTVDK